MTTARRMWVRGCAAGVSVLIAQAATAAPPLQVQWRPFRAGNTGVQGDYCEMVYVGPDGDPWIGGYIPFQEEGGMAKFVRSENRWINISNADYPVIGSRDDIGSSRFADMARDAAGRFWIGTWRGLVRYDPAIGPSSLMRWDASNSPMPGGRVSDVAVAPDGTVWCAIISVSWGFGGLTRYNPASNAWTVWGMGSGANGWPGWSGTTAVSVQPDAVGSGYTVWVAADANTLSFRNNVFTPVAPGTIYSLPGKRTLDATGNQWVLRQDQSTLQVRLEIRRNNGTFVPVPQPPVPFINYSGFTAIGSGEALLGTFGGQVYRFDGSAWVSLGSWGGSYVDDLDRGSDGTIWIAGIGGAAKHLGGTAWQRYRVTNTGLMGDFNNDIAVDPLTGKVGVCTNAGTGYGGFSVFDGGQRWEPFCSGGGDYGIGRPFPFPSDNSTAITMRPGGRVAFAPTFNGVHQWDGVSFSVIAPTGDFDRLREDSLGRLWGIYHYGGYARLDDPVPVIYNLGGPMYSLQRDPDNPGAVQACSWFTLERNDGVTRRAWDVSMFPLLNPQSDGFVGSVAAPGGIIWIGTTNGLIRLDTVANTYQHLTTQNSAIPGNGTVALTVTPDGRVWFTASMPSAPLGQALVAYDGVTFNVFTTANSPLPHPDVRAASWRPRPGRGYEMWITCVSRGVMRLTVQGAPCPGDADGDGAVSFADLNLVLGQFGQSGPALAGDLNGDGLVGFADLNFVLGNFGRSC